MAGTKHTERDRAKLPATYTWPCFLNYLPSAAPLKKAESVLYVPSHDSCKAILQGWFSQLFFNALLVCPLISPLVSVCLSTHKKYNLTCNDFVRRTNDIFSKAKFVDKGWIHSEMLSVTDMPQHYCAERQFHMCFVLRISAAICVICASASIQCTNDRH